ncbi:methionyl-tRNA formyltransferase [Endozoicomonas acroporae]|uniref:methionyl-tRNA formyltransferase n=1 Tax=Endozoicomonas acroporae TaxID=1701104 RepID=UPI000C77CBB7|nr:formyltransferase family protein [Endozoicomonas acroporae]
MRIGYFADGPWSHKALELIVNSDELEIVFIVPRFDTRDPILQEWATKLKIPFIIEQNVNSDGFIEKIEKYTPDLLVSMSFNQILRERIINFAPKGFINCHAGALPYYRGRNPLNWVLINGEKSFGITVHYVDKGIDTGDIIDQKIFPISNKDNYKTLLETAITQCGYVLHSAIMKIFSNKVKIKKQSDIHPVGTYFGMRKVGDEVLDFRWESARVFNFIRAISTPGPCARIYSENEEYAIESATMIDNAPNYIATIGEVVGRSTNGVVIKTGDSTILINEVRKVLYGVLQEIMVPEFKIGTRFKV